MMPSCLSILFRALRIEWRETKRTLLPTTPIETGLFLFFFLLYGCIGYRMLFHTELIDVPNGGAGSYLGYDNLFHLHTRGGAFDISHYAAPQRYFLPLDLANRKALCQPKNQAERLLCR